LLVQEFDPLAELLHRRGWAPSELEVQSPESRRRNRRRPTRPDNPKEAARNEAPQIGVDSTQDSWKTPSFAVAEIQRIPVVYAFTVPKIMMTASMLCDGAVES